MFANFIYFIVALLILSLYEAPEELPFTLGRALFLFVVTLLIFVLNTYNQFRRLSQRVGLDNHVFLDQRFDQLSMRHAIFALVLFAVDIWWLHLPAHMQPLEIFALLPTLKSLVLLAVFVGYLSLIWFLSYDAHRRIYHTELSRREYVYSNVAFSVPILIPWTLLFGIADILRLLPFELPRRILDSTAGETGYFLIFLIIAAIFAPLMVQRFWRCNPLPDGPDRSRIEALCRRAGVRYADIVHWPIFGGRMITAGVMGLVGRFRYIMVTEALLEHLTPDEIDQVIAHEIGHVKRKHLLLYLLFFMGFMVISYTVFFISNYLFFFTQPAIWLIVRFKLNIQDIHFYFSTILLIISIVCYFRYLFGYFMRNFERQADGYVFELYPTAQPLISTFNKITASSGQPADKPNWHHFSIQQRIDFLRRCESSRHWIRRHDRKVKKRVVFFLVGIVVLAVTSFQLNQMTFGRGARYINAAYIEAYLDQKAEKTEEDAVLYWLLGNVAFEKQELPKAGAAYEAALALSPDNPDVLNNLAWLRATSDDPTLRDTRRALKMAERAIQLKKAPHIWDTLAEALFVNGHIDAAIEAERRALAMDPPDRHIYEGQMEKFQRVLEQGR